MAYDGQFVQGALANMPAKKVTKQLCFKEQGRDIFDDYEIIEESFIQGGQATIMKAFHRASSKCVAIKKFAC